MPGLRNSRAWATAALSCAALVASLSLAAAPAAAQGEDAYVPGELLVTFEKGVSAAEGEGIAAELGGDVVDRATLVPRLSLVELPPGLAVERAEDRFDALDGVLRTEPNAIRESALQPNDPFYVGDLQWGLTNAGAPPFSGKEDADIDAPGAWGLATGDPSVKVAVIDSGANVGHPDLEANIWTNPTEAIDGSDDPVDPGTKVDDVHGWDFVNDDANPADDNSHGSHVAGIIGAVADNAEGVAGVNWDTSILPLKASNAAGQLTLFNIIAATDYAVAHGAKVINASYVGEDFSTSERNAISAAGAAGTLLVAAAGNSGTDNDITPYYPCNYDLSNVICVANTDKLDNRSASSNYGKNSVDLAAPGSVILSTINAGYAGAPIRSDDFEGGLGQWTPDVSSTWADASESPFTPGSHLSDSPGGQYAVDTDYSVSLATPVDLTGENVCRTTFDLAYTLAAGDTLWVEASNDALTWTPLAAYSGTRTAETEDVPLLGFSGDAVVHLRFRLESDSADVEDGVHIDDFALACADGTATSLYNYKSGTSMATPHVAGVAALLLDRFPTYTPAQLRDALLGNVDRLSSLHCVVATGGRLNAFDALDNGVPATPPAADCPPVSQPPTTQNSTASSDDALTKAIKRCKRKFRKGSRERKRCIAKARLNAVQ